MLLPLFEGQCLPGGQSNEAPLSPPAAALAVTAAPFVAAPARNPAPKPVMVKAMTVETSAAPTTGQ